MPEPNQAAFKPTRWSLVLQLRGEGEQARRALEELCATYWFPLYAWSRRCGASAEDAADHVQGFFVQVLRKDLFSAANPELGKLRTFLLTAFRRHVNDEQRKLATEKRGGDMLAPIDPAEAEMWYEAEHIEGESADHLYDRQWALAVLNQALDMLARQASAKGKAAEFAAARPFLTSEAGTEEYAEAGRPFGMSANAFKVAVHRLRSRFRDALREEIAQTQPEGASVDEEMGYLMQVLRG